jgi:hypothetical protein
LFIIITHIIPLSRPAAAEKMDIHAKSLIKSILSHITEAAQSCPRVCAKEPKMLIPVMEGIKKDSSDLLTRYAVTAIITKDKSVPPRAMKKRGPPARPVIIDEIETFNKAQKKAIFGPP